MPRKTTGGRGEAPRAAAALAAGLLAFVWGLAPAWAAATERAGTVTLTVKLPAAPGAKEVRLWVPLPVSDRHQTVGKVAATGNFTSSGARTEPRQGVSAFFAEWKGPMAERELTLTFDVSRREAVMKEFPAEEAAIPDEVRPFLDNSALGDVRGRVEQLAAEATAGKTTTLGKARAVYDWVVANMRRDPDVKGCGTCEIERLLAERAGKCADIHAVYTALARAAGVPARDIYGIRMHGEREGEITKWQKCWAEYYQPGSGWVPIDPADVLKFKLQKDPTAEELAAKAAYFFGAVDASRIRYNAGSRVLLEPPPRSGELLYFMYPWAEADGKPLNEDLFGYNLGYRITFREK